MDNLEPIGRRSDPVKVGDTVFYYPESSSGFVSPVAVKVTEVPTDDYSYYRVKGESGPSGILRHDHMYRKGQ